MTIFTIALGLLGLGIVVFFHELGHFIAAKLVQVDVEEFSLGWGPRLVSKKIGATNYTLSAFPIGGYCRMKGEKVLKQAIEEGLENFPHEQGSYFSASPGRRILISFGGPAMNIVFAFIVYILIMAHGISINSWGNTILLASSVDGASYPADAAGLRSGDIITSINTKPIQTFADVQEAIAMSPKTQMIFGVMREGVKLDIAVTPEMDKNSGAGRIGIFPWIEPVIEHVAPNGAAALAGLMPGDSVQTVDGKPVHNTMDIASMLSASKPTKTSIAYERGGQRYETAIVPSYTQEGNPDLGIGWKSIRQNIKASSFIDALAMGTRETGKTISATYKGLASLFMGVNLLKAVSGPARITWIVGSVARDGFSVSGVNGFFMALNFLALLSIGLFAMNLLPIPLLDGGAIVLFVFELIRGKAVKIKTLMRYQTVGVITVAALFLLATIGDFIFFAKK